MDDAWIESIEKQADKARKVGDWSLVIDLKMQIAKARGAKKRGWIPLRKAFLNSSINYRMELSEQMVFLKLVLMADDYGPVPGLISDNDFRPMPHDYLAHQAHCPPEVMESTIEKGKADDGIYENAHGLYFTHFDDYQYTAYDRQKPWRDEQKAKKFKQALSPEEQKEHNRLINEENKQHAEAREKAKRAAEKARRDEKG